MKMACHRDDPGLLVIASTGGLSDSIRMAMVREVYQQIDHGLRKIIIDCSSMDYISSLDLGVLARLRGRVTRKGGDLKLSGVTGMVAEVLRITRLDQLFDMYPDLESARLAFDARGA